VPTANDFLASTRLNVEVKGADALRVRNNVADVRGDVELTVRGTLATPGVTGSVTLDPGGTLIYNGNEFVVQRGLLTFENPYLINPEIDLEARTEVRNYDIVLTVSGTLDRLDFQYSSDEGLSYLEVLALVTGGPEIESDRRLQVPGEQQEADVGAGSFLAGQAAAALSQRVNTLFGFDRFRIDPVPTETGRVIGGGVQLTVGKRISRDLFVTYTTNPSASEDYLVRAEWQVAKDLVLVFTRNGQNDTYAVDAQWERRF
jgi:translocation and assembly module TamB